jgi:hypothetical protein
VAQPVFIVQIEGVGDRFFECHGVAGQGLRNAPLCATE